MRTKNKIGGYIIRSAAYAVFFSLTFIALGSAFNSSNRRPKSVEAAGAYDRMANTPGQGRSFTVAERIEFSASREHVGGREIAGFSARTARTAHEKNLTPPSGLKPVEQEAWLAMARRHGARGGMELASFYPARYGQAFVVEGEGVRVAVRPVGGTNATAQIDNGQVIYREAYPETDSMHVVSSGRSEEFLFLQNECAPREFAYELSELSNGTRVELVKGEVRFTNKAGHGVKIEAPWLIEATGERRAGAVRWELEESKSGALPRLRLVVAEGLSYPVLIDPSWVTTGSLATARFRHTATLLSSGKVLVAGGQNSGGYLSSAELYNPATGSWSSTGSLHTARCLHTATLLPNGKVLVAGGFGLSNYLSSAELYNPATGSWSSTGSLGTARRDHTATLLPNGKVLVAGGFNGGYPSSAELYNPATGSWSSTGSIGTPRTDHTATLLSNGKVLVAGGFAGGYLISAELYNPATGSWSSTGSLAAPREFHTATLLPNGKVLAAGGDFNGNPLDSAELYDPATGIWSSTGSLDTARSDHTGTLLPNGKALVAGGLGFSGRLNSAELYNPATGSWSETGSLNTARRFHTATLLPNGNVLAAGGDGISGNPLDSAELYGGSPTPTPTPAVTLHNISTRSFVQTGDNVMIGGFIVQGVGPKRVIIRAIGPELSRYGVPGALQNPTLELHGGNGTLIASNDDWQHTIIGGIITHDQVSDIRSSGLAPGDLRESAIIAELPAGNYTAIVRGLSGSMGVALVEVYDLGTNTNSILGNISTRSFVQTGDKVMIGGFIVQGTGRKSVIIRAIGPELSRYGVPDPLQNPTLELHGGNGALIASNDDWQHTIIGGIITHDQVSDIRTSGHAPGDLRESAIIAELAAGNYTAIVRGVSGTMGVALVEVYDLD
jgi:N-acetylneuraminic acid mutarotase